ncbi:MAG: toluene tolerance protein [Syntrophobacterales bacterium CG_4_8_14_3_um_filter_58_8]|nr:MAG: toluene tolerance protein [Syntrophobacterales bacterium CG_4_8_14_3_um_filter_58_8]
MKRPIVVLNIIIPLLFSLPVYAGPPLDAVQANVNKVLEVLRDPKLKAASAKEIRKEKLRLIYERMFDDVELSKRTLSRHWNSMNVAQRKEFVLLFRQVLEKAYIDKILAYTDEKIVFDRENMVSETQAEIQTIIVTASKEIPITYRVILKGGAWKVYDIVIENVSLVLNYRTQFNDILAKNTPEQLLEILRKKVKGQ